MFEFTGQWAAFAVYATIVAGVAVAFIVADARKRRRQAAAEADEAAYRLFAAQDLAEYPPGLTWSSNRAVADSMAALDERTAALVIDPTLSAADVATAIEHVAPGVGSLTAFAAALPDTSTTRTPTEVRRLDEAWAPAHEEHADRLEREFFLEFDTAMEAALTDWAVGTRVVEKWQARHHDDDRCPICEEILHEITDEHRHIVSTYPTGAYPLVVDLRKLATVR